MPTPSDGDGGMALCCFDEAVSPIVPASSADLQIGTADVATEKANKATGSTARPDFTGSWRCIRIRGDMEAFLDDMGLRAPLRKAALEANYGAGRQVQHIMQNGDLFEVENVLQSAARMTFHVGGGEQPTFDQVGSPIIVVPWWDGPTLVVASWKKTGEAIARSKRYLVGREEMILEFTSRNGTVVERIFARSVAEEDRRHDKR